MKAKEKARIKLNIMKALVMFLIFMLTPPWFATARAQEKQPTTEEIKDLVNQAESATSIYEQLVATLALDANFSSNDNLEDAKQTVITLKKEISQLKGRPEVYKPSMAFALDSSLSDASRLTALCAGQALAFASAAPKQFKNYMQLSGSCRSTSALLYSVCERSGDLTMRSIMVLEDSVGLHPPDKPK